MRTLSTLLVLFIAVSTYAQTLLRNNEHLNDMEYHTASDRIYGIQGGAHTNGNAVLVINPSTAVVENRIPVDNEPFKLAFSYNQKYLYIAYLGTNKLDRLTMSDFSLETVVVMITKDTFEAPYLERTFVNYIHALVASPAHPDGIIFTRARNIYGGYESMTVFDGNVTLPNEIDYTSATVNLAYHENTGIVYGYGNIFGSPKILKYSMNENGFGAFSEHDFTSFWEYLEIKIAGDRLVNQEGEVLDISGTTPVLMGDAYEDFNRYYRSGVHEIDPTTNILYSVDYENDMGDFQTYLYRFDLDDFTLIDKVPLGDRYFSGVKMVFTGQTGRMAILSHQSSFSDVRPQEGYVFILNMSCPSNSDLETLNFTLEPKVCRDSIIVLSAEEVHDHYLWYDGYDYFNGKVLNYRAGNYDEFTNISVKGFDKNGCLVAASDTKEFQIVSPTTVEIEQSDLVQFCREDSVQLVATALDPNASFVWSNGDTMSTIFVKEPNLYSVKAYVTENCPASEPESILLEYFPGLPIPTARLSHSGLVELCPYESLIVSALDSFYRYNWLPYNEKVTRSNLVETQSILSLRYEDPFGCFGPSSDELQVTYKAEIAPPVLSLQEYLLITDAVGEIEWYRNGKLIEGPSGNNYLVAQQGMYQIKLVLDNECKSIFSNAIFVEEGTPGESIKIKGNVYLDLNANGTKDGDEKGIYNQSILRNPDNVLTFSGQNGDYNFDAVDGYHDINVVIDSEVWSVIEGINGHKLDPLADPDLRYNFGLMPNNIVQGLMINFQTGTTRCSRMVPSWTNVRNTGNVVFNGEVCVDIDSKIELIEHQGSTITDVPEKLCWSVDDLQIGESRDFNFKFKVPSFQFTGKYLRFSAYGTNGIDKIDEYDYESLILCSYDPNDKLVSPKRGLNGDYALFSDTLNYTIRFQNTGNDTAFQITLVDELSEYLDWSTFRPISASHPYTTRLDQNTGVFEVLFDNILLPDSTTDLTGSQGYFSFYIVPNEDLEESTKIENEAQIFFDFNPAIITNITSSEMVSIIPTTSTHPTLNQSHKGIVEVYPNPHRKEVNFKFFDILERSSLTIISSTGQQMYSKSLSQKDNNLQLNTELWPNAMYFYILRDFEYSILESGSFIKAK